MPTPWKIPETGGRKPHFHRRPQSGGAIHHNHSGLIAAAMEDIIDEQEQVTEP